MNKETLFGSLDELSQKWKALEKIVATGPSLADESSRLSVQRHGSTMRLCFNGRPLTECSTTEKIEAADPEVLAAFYSLYKSYYGSLQNQIENAIELVTEWTSKFEALGK
jgi:hypothetical protein